MTGHLPSQRKSELNALFQKKKNWPRIEWIFQFERLEPIRMRVGKGADQDRDIGR